MKAADTTATAEEKQLVSMKMKKGNKSHVLNHGTDLAEN